MTLKLYDSPYIYFICPYYFITFPCFVMHINLSHVLHCFMYCMHANKKLGPPPKYIKRLLQLQTHNKHSPYAKNIA